MQKGVNFIYFNQKNTHISGCKIVYIYKNATVTMHICMVPVTLQIIFYYFFLSPSPDSLFFYLVLPLSPLALFISGPLLSPH